MGESGEDGETIASGGKKNAVSGDAAEGVVWMSYAELGELLGIKSASAKRLSFRRGWGRQEANDGGARIAVPVDVVDAARGKAGDIPSGMLSQADDGQVAVPGDVAAAVAAAVSEVVATMTAAHTTEMARVAVAHTAELVRLGEAARAELARAGQAHHAEIERLRQDHRAEVERLMRPWWHRWWHKG